MNLSIPTPGATRRHRMRFGAEIADGGTRFRFWAPKHETVALQIEGEKLARPMRAAGDGWHELVVASADAGTLYRFILSDGLAVPDPASRFQPHDVHGPSEVIDPESYHWSDTDWRGRPWEEAVLYELHVGTFTTAGTYRAAIDKLDHLVGLGITAIELMPLSDFPGTRNWGYDCVLPFAPEASYGRPEELKALIDAAHRKGLMVFLDVVYNHFGPDGNYIGTYAPIFTERHHTPWGAAVNFDSDGSSEVRAFVMDSVLTWIEEYRFDGLRFDAVQAILDDTAPHILEQIAHRAREVASDRHVHLVLENADNVASRLNRDEAGSPLQFTAQWSDDIHHSLHAYASAEDDGYYADFFEDPAKLGRALAEGFSYQGEMQEGRLRGEPSAGLPPTAFVAFVQNHDQIGNRALGDRLTEYSPAAACRAVAAIYLLSPHIPLLFMGEEWAASTPFPFFCDFNEELAEAVRVGRREEFARFVAFQDPAAQARIPDPTLVETFHAAKLNWKEAESGAHAEWLTLYRALLALRHEAIVPRLRNMGGHSGSYEVLGKDAIRVEWRMGDGARLTLVANLSPNAFPAATQDDGRIWLEGTRTESMLGPWSVLWTLRPDAGDGR